MEFDKDLRSIQEVRNLVEKAKTAQKEYANFNQAQVDKIVHAITVACEAFAETICEIADAPTTY